ncbi:MAG: SGNH/GDSL hydrolase family protein [Oscillospiraceae bacterium]|jgi:lysophospholipase L1-like esterase|nr:SGNH/GDSL hydrolase family protein [Oscillospiraceae bacterium]
MKRLALFLLLSALFLSGCSSVDDSIPPPMVPDDTIVTFTPPASITAQPSVSVPPDVSPPEETTADTSPEPQASVPPLPSFTIDDITFLGDSTTYGLKAYEMLSGGKNTAQVWTPSSGTLALFNQSFATIVYPPTGTEIPIREAVADSQPKLLIVTLGVNGVSTMDESDFKADYSDLIEGIQAASPNTVIVLQSIFPVASHYGHLGSINNDKISAANVWIKEIAGDYGLTYVDTYSQLVGSDGWLPENIQNGDGLHLNSNGFSIVLNNIRNELGITK